MKKLHFILTFYFFLFLPFGFLFAQNVGIGTTTPNNSAVLDLTSNNKGLLLPRLNNTQMFAIPSPAAGLLVYNTSYNEFYQYDGTSWRPVLNGTYWRRPLNNRDVISNGTDSVGIGMSVPTERLDVNGNIRSRGRVDADGVVQAAGLSSTGALYVAGTSLLAGAVTGNSSASFGGNINSNTSMSISDAAGILEFKNGSTEKGFVQSSGDDIRVGTFSSNAAGRFIVRTQGANHMVVSNDGVVLPSNQEINRSATGTSDLLPYAYGTINSDGTIANGTGNFTVVKSLGGRYEITVTGLTNSAVPLVTCRWYQHTATASWSNNKIIVDTWDAGLHAEADVPFTFLVFKL